MLARVTGQPSPPASANRRVGGHVLMAGTG
jgi:hypothetical protein